MHNSWNLYFDVMLNSLWTYQKRVVCIEFDIYIFIKYMKVPAVH